MKSFIFKSLLVAFFIISAVSCSAQRLFNDVPSDDDITKIYVGKAMLKMSGLLDAAENSDSKLVNGIGGTYITNEAIKALDALEVVTCEKKSKINELKKICMKAVDTAALELVTEVEDESDVVKIYVAPDNDNDNIVSNLVILVQEPDEFVAINIAGKLDLTKLAQSIKSDTIDSGNLPLN